MNRISQFQRDCEPQAPSPLFSLLPGEIREAIYIEALKSYDDESHIYDKDTAYRRPGYLGKPKTNCALLQTCQAIYNEAWFRPWVSRVHTLWLAWDSRRPSQGNLTTESLQEALTVIYERHGEVPMAHVRVFSQLCNIQGMYPILNLSNFYPHVLTLTLRHHDWWSWENDARLYIGNDLPNLFRGSLPASLQEFRMELESLERKKDQIDYVASQMVQSWRFSRTDGVAMTAQVEDFELDTWRGSSTWESTRWLRDEIAPETLQYYVKTVVWRPNLQATVSSTDRLPGIYVPESFATLQPNNFDNVHTNSLEAAGVPPGTSAETVKEILIQSGAVNDLWTSEDDGEEDDDEVDDDEGDDDEEDDDEVDDDEVDDDEGDDDEE